MRALARLAIITLGLTASACSPEKPCYFRCVGQENCTWYNSVTESACRKLSQQECTRRNRPGVDERAWAKTPPAWCPHELTEEER